MTARFGAVIVNYDCAPLALDAALSVLGDGAVCAVIVDNSSSDNSLEYFNAVFSGDRDHVSKPPADPECDGEPIFSKVTKTKTAFRRQGDAIGPEGVVVIKARENRGFAAGCNIGLKALINAGGIDHFLLLNPDAVIAAGSIKAFADRLGERGVGLCGASVVRYEAPHRVQALGGGALNPITMLGRNLGEGLAITEAPDIDVIESDLDYPLGAAIALRRDYIEAVGFMDERYFLYYEEADWAFSGVPTYHTAWAPDALVYHHYGASSKSAKPLSPQAPSQRSALADYHMARSRLLFTAKWRPLLTPVSIALGGVQAVRRIARGKPQNAHATMMGALPAASRRYRG